MNWHKTRREFVWIVMALSMFALGHVAPLDAALSRVKNWIANETLTASDLNAEFNNLLNNALSLISPLTGTLAAGGNDITGLDELALNDAAADATAAGRLRRNGSTLTYHGHIAVVGTAPTVGTCGTSPSIAGTDQAGRVVTGTGGTTACTVTFGTAWTTAPACAIGPAFNTPVTQILSTTTTIGLSWGSACNGCTVDYVCMGRG